MNYGLFIKLNEFYNSLIFQGNKYYLMVLIHFSIFYDKYESEFKEITNLIYGTIK